MIAAGYFSPIRTMAELIHFSGSEMHPWAAGPHEADGQAPEQGVSMFPQYGPQKPLPVLTHVGARQEYWVGSYGGPYWEQMFCRALIRDIGV